MLRISISKPGTPTRTNSFDKREITVGRTAANDLVIAEPGVSGNHARILYLDGELTVIDLDSTNGTFVNGQRIQGPHIVRPGDEIYICAHRLTFEADDHAAPAGSRPPSMPPVLSGFPGTSATSGPPPVFPTLPPPTLGDAPHHSPPPSGPSASLPPLLSPPEAFPPSVEEALPPDLPPVADSLPAFPDELALPDLPPVLPSYPSSGSSVPRAESDVPPPLAEFTEGPNVLPPPPVLDASPPPPQPPAGPSTSGSVPRALERLYDDTFFALVQEFAESGPSSPDTPQLRTRVRTRAKELLAQRASEHPDVDTGTVAQTMTDELLDRDRLSGLAGPGQEVVLFGPRKVQAHGPGGRSPQPLSLTFSCRKALEYAVRRATGQPFDAAHPVLSASTPEGTSVHAIHDLLAPDGPLVVLHGAAPASRVTQLDDLVRRAVLGTGTAALLRAVAQAGSCILICAAPGTDGLELCSALAHTHPAGRQAWLSPFGRTSHPLPPGTVTLHASTSHAGTEDPRRLLVRAAAGLAPERLWAHDVAGPEAADLLVLFGGSRIGGAMTVRASSPQEGIERLATSACLGLGGDVGGLRRLVVQTIDLVVAIGRKMDGSPVLTHVAEPQMSPAGAPHMQDLVHYDFRSGTWSRTGSTPTFLGELQRRGIAVDFNSA